MFLTATREPVFPPVRLHFLPAETALTRNWHSPRSHSGTLSSRKRSGSLGGKKPRCESHFTRNVEPRYLQSRFLLQRANHKTDLFFLRPFFFPYYMVVDHGHEDCRRILLVYSSRDFARIFSRLWSRHVDFHNYSEFKEHWFVTARVTTKYPLIHFFSIVLNVIRSLLFQFYFPNYILTERSTALFQQ